MDEEIMLATINQLLIDVDMGSLLKKKENCPWDIIHRYFRQLDEHPHVTGKQESQNDRLYFHRVYIALLRKAVLNYFCQSSLPIASGFFDMVRWHTVLSLKFYPASSDYYFDLSLTYLTSDETIAYLNGTSGRDNGAEAYLLDLFLVIGANAVFSKTSASYSICVSRKNTPTFFQIHPSTERLLQALLNHCNNFFLSTKELPSQSVRFVLEWLVNMTEIHGFVPYFVKAHYPEAVLTWLKIRQDQMINGALASADYWFLILNLLHNLARHWMGVKSLNKLKAISILKQWEGIHLKQCSASAKHDENDKNILIVYYLLYCALLEPKELKKESIDNLQQILDYILERTVRAFDSPDLSCGPYNICECLHGVAKFVVNDTFLRYSISRENIFELFLTKFLQFNKTCHETDLNAMICASLYSIFWSISFHSEFASKLKAHAEFLASVEEKAKQECNDEQSIIMKRAAKGILYNLDIGGTDLEIIDEPVEIERHEHLKVMVSYAHKDATFCKNLVSTLQERLDGDIWVDFNKLSSSYDDDWEEIAKAITQCDVIIMIVTENYCSSKSCRREVIHADKRNKRMIPIYIGKDYKPEDWFEIRVGSATWVRFGDKKTDDEAMSRLLGLLQRPNMTNPMQSSDWLGHQSMENHQSSKVISQQPSLISRTTSVMIDRAPGNSKQNLSEVVSTSPIEEWTSEDVQQWLPQCCARLQLSSGPALLAYMNLLKDENAQYNEYEERVRHLGVSREEFSNLIASFASLRSKSTHTKTSNEAKPEQWSHVEVRQWFEDKHFSPTLLDSLQFQNGSHLLMYAKLLVRSSSRMEEEYERLKRCLVGDSFHLGEYVRFVHALKGLFEERDLEEASCTIL